MIMGAGYIPYQKYPHQYCHDLTSTFSCVVVEFIAVVRVPTRMIIGDDILLNN